MDEDVKTRHEESGPPAEDVAVDQPFRVGRYTVTRRIGAGGMGVIYLAYDDELDRRVALKLVHASRGGSLGRARMLREAQALAKLSHPNVVHVYEVGDVDDRVYLAMEFLAGVTLRAWLKGQPRTWREILDVHIQAGRGLAAAHAAGLVHRDFKPDNAIVDADGRVRVIDFGLARGHEPGGEAPLTRSRIDELVQMSPPLIDSQGLSGPLTEAGALLGTPAYMSPEQLLRGPADARSDQFGFCVTLWEALHGERPFPGRTLAELAPQVFAGPPRPPRGRVPAVVSRVLRRGLAVDPEARYPDMPALLAALAAAAGRRRRGLTIAAAALVVAGASAGGYALAGARAGACDADAALVGAWDPALREAAGAAVLATGAPFAEDAWRSASSELDGYAKELGDMWERTCRGRDAGALAAETAALQDACLERRRSELAAVAEVLRRADREAVRGAMSAVAGLGSLTRCEDLTALRAEAEQVPPPRDAALAARVASLRERLAGVKAEHDAGRVPAAAAAVPAILDEVERVEYPPLLAEALLRAGAIRSAAGEYEAARGDLHRAFALAEEVRHEAIAASAAASLVHLHGARLRDPAAALTWAEVADAKLRRIGDERLRVMLLLNRGMTLGAADRVDEAAGVLEQALTLAAARKTEAPLQYVKVLNSLANTLSDQGRLDEAAALFDESYLLRRRLLGESHPDVALALHALGKIELARQDAAASVQRFRQALEIRERSLGPRHPGVAETLGGLAVAACQAQLEDECLPLMRRTVALAEEIHGADDPALVVPLSNLGSELTSHGEFSGAEQVLRRALGILAAAGSRETSEVALIHYNLGLLAKLRGDPGAALVELRRALELREAIYGPDHVEVGFAVIHLGDALRHTGHAEEAEAAARRARTIFEGHPEARLAVVSDRLTEAALRWRSDPAAARALAAAAADDLGLADAAAVETRERIATWLREHPG